MARSYHSSVRHDILPLVPQSERLLDVGGGTGETAIHLKEIARARKVGVLDAVAPAAGGALDYSADLDLTDGAALDEFLVQNGPFDTLLFLDVLEHLPDPWATVRAFARHVPAGGTMIVSVPNVRHYSVVLPLLLGDRWRYEEAGILDRTHLRFFTRESAASLLDCPELTIEKVIAKPPSRRRDALIDKATLGALRGFLTYQYFVVAKRKG